MACGTFSVITMILERRLHNAISVLGHFSDAKRLKTFNYVLNHACAYISSCNNLWFQFESSSSKLEHHAGKKCHFNIIKHFCLSMTWKHTINAAARIHTYINTYVRTSTDTRQVHAASIGTVCLFVPIKQTTLTAFLLHLTHVRLIKQEKEGLREWLVL